jgi:hypothetical protein
MEMKTRLSFLFVILAAVCARSQTPDAVPSASGSNVEKSVSAVSSPQTTILPEIDKLEAAASQLSLDLGKLHIEKWKASSTAKSEAQANAGSVQRNLTAALPGLIGAVRSEPDDLNAQFKLYRNLNALCDVVNSLTDETRAFGPAADFEALAQQSQLLTGVRRNLGESLEQQTEATQQELKQARIQIKTQQEQLAAAKAQPPKVIVVAASEPPKKPAPKKKAVAKKPVSTNSGSDSNSPAPNSTGQTPSGTPPPKS